MKSFPRQRRQVKLMTDASGVVAGSVMLCWLWEGWDKRRGGEVVRLVVGREEEEEFSGVARDA